MKVLFINPSVGYYTRALSNPLGLLSIATYVKQHGHEVKLEDRCVNKSNINKLLYSFSHGNVLNVCKESLVIPKTQNDVYS